MAEIVTPDSNGDRKAWKDREARRNAFSFGWATANCATWG
jgi:hypothetical protein